ncbi:MAG: hypothetical protein ACR2H5_08310 [Ktedonobacteraceae bacterium]
MLITSAKIAALGFCEDAIPGAGDKIKKTTLKEQYEEMKNG